MAFLSYCTTCYTFAKHSVILKANISPTISFIEVFTAYFTAPVSNRMASVTLSSPPCIPHNSEFHWQKKVVRKLLCHVIFLSYKRCYLRISAMRFLDGLTLVTPRKDVLWVVFGLNYILMKVLIFWVSWLAEYTGADWVVGVSKRTRTQDKTPSVVPVAPECSEPRCWASHPLPHVLPVTAAAGLVLFLQLWKQGLWKS